jgi:hypothetical protein
MDGARLNATRGDRALDGRRDETTTTTTATGTKRDARTSVTT